MDLTNASSNWKKLQASGVLQKTSTALTHPAKTRKRKRNDEITSKSISVSRPERKRQRAMNVLEQPSEVVETVPQTIVNSGWNKEVEIGKYIALDCEMVGIGPDPQFNSALARISIINYNGEQIYDSYVRPKELVMDWRTHVSGIAPKHMRDARTLDAVQKDVSEILTDRIVIGHSVRNDFDVLFLDHPKRDIRDTSKYLPYKKWAGGTPKLKMLASGLLGLEIQDGEHSSVEDARACMLLFRRDRDGFEKEHVKKWPLRPQNNVRNTPKKKRKGR